MFCTFNVQALECGTYLLRGVLLENQDKKDSYKLDSYVLITDANSNSEIKWSVTPSKNFQKDLKYFLRFMVLAKLNVKKETSFSGEIEEIKWTTPALLPYEEQDILSIQIVKKAACEK